MNKLDDISKETLEFIIVYQAHNGTTPTFQVIGDNFGISKAAAYDRFKKLRKNGYVETISENTKGYRVLKMPDDSISETFLFFNVKERMPREGAHLLLKNGIDYSSGICSDGKIHSISGGHYELWSYLEID